MVNYILSCRLSWSTLLFFSGTIIDSFGALRDEQEYEHKEMNSLVRFCAFRRGCYILLILVACRVQCFICSNKQEILEQRGGPSFRQHLRDDHYMWNYMYYIAYLEDMSRSEYNGIEAYVRQKYDEGDPSFFPIKRALVLEQSSTAVWSSLTDRSAAIAAADAHAQKAH